MRFLGISIALICVLVGIVYFSTSYQLGRDAEKELEKGNFQEAHALAIQALEEDPYNRLAFAVANQAKQRLNIQNFLKQSKENQQDAFNILKDGSLSPEEFLRLEWMVEEFNRSYRGLLILNQPNEKEKEQLEQYKLWFENLNQRLNEVKQIKNG
ncbi:hypothetical protein LS70_007330 [Helicobacter sp. MIT 11-5569]|uniref:hypothetical protein n=1 Tax=Helicobacter sp. MIT 11-5569 TaxID=1548151 RepID=UPI00069095A9|nr:hypothetical protein [Helicobacter sp. MIT 11-5569]TLD82408.1 hypothetical protein LS70_007330 [Helicobacter sp. MIT 11-5569]